MRRVAGLACFVVAAVLFVSYSSQDQQVVLFVPPVGAPAASMLAAPSAAAAVPTYVVPSASVASSTLIASSAGDFGGYTIPIIGLVILAATVAFLAGPVEDQA
jgi:hypothetical protein